MTFNELTYGIAFLAPLFGGIAEGRKAGLLGVLIGLFVGLGLGIGCFFATKAVFKWVRQHPELGKGYPSTFWGLVVWLLLVGLFACMGLSCVLGMLATKLVVTHVTA